MPKKNKDKEPKPELQLTPQLYRLLERYRKRKQVEKRLAKLIKEEADEIKAYAKGKEYDLLYGDRLVASLTESSKTCIDSELLQEKYPDVYKEVIYKSISLSLNLK